MLLFFRSGFFRVVVSGFSGCVKVLSVLGWFIMTSLGGPNWVTQTSWSGIRSECYNSTKHCCFTERPCLMVTGSGTGCDRTVLRNLGLLLWARVLLWLVSVLSFVRLSSSFFLSFFLLSFFLSFSLSLSRGLTCRIRPLALSRRHDDAPHTPPPPPP